MTQDEMVVMSGTREVAVVPLEQLLQMLHPTQRRAYTAVREYWRLHKFAPSMQDIGDALGISSRLARYHVTRLERAGLVERTPHVARSVRPVQLRQVDHHAA